MADLFAKSTGLDAATPVAGADLFGAPQAKPSAIAEGFRGATAGAKASLAGFGALAASAVGADTVKQAALQTAAEQQAIAEEHGRRIEDVKDAGGAWEHYKYLLGAAAPTLGLMLAGGLAGRGLGAVLSRGGPAAARAAAMRAGTLGGAVATDVPLEAGEIYTSALAEGVGHPELRAATGGVLAAALDFIPLLSAEKYLKAAGKGGYGAMAKAAGKGAAVGAALEGGQEAAQAIIERAAAGKSLTDGDAISDYVNSFAGGAAPGVLLGAGAGAAHARAPAQEQQAAPLPLPADKPLPSILGEDALNAQISDTSLLGSLADAQGGVPPQPLSTTGPQLPATDVPVSYNRPAALVAEDADIVARDNLVGERATAATRAAEIGQQLLDTPGRRERALLQRELDTVQATIPAMDTRIGAMNDQLGNRSRIAVLPDVPEAAPRAERTGRDPLYEQAAQIVQESGHESVALIQRRLKIGYDHAQQLLAEIKSPIARADSLPEIAPDTTEAERGIAATKRALGMLVSSREAQLAPVHDTHAPALAVERQNVRSTERQPDQKTLTGAMIAAGRQVVAQDLPKLIATKAEGSLQKPTPAQNTQRQRAVQDAVDSVITEAAALPSVEQAQAHVRAELPKTLKGKMDAVTVGEFAERVAKGLGGAQRFYSKDKVEPVGPDGLRESDRQARKIDSHVSEFTAQVLESVNAPNTVLQGAKQWAKDNNVDEGQFRRALYKHWRAAPSPKLQDLSRTILSAPDAQHSVSSIDASQDVYDDVLERQGLDGIKRFQFLYGEHGETFDIFNVTADMPNAGYYQPMQEMKDVVGFAYNNNNILSVADHEAFHALEQRKLDAREMMILTRAYRPGQPLFQQVVDRAQRYDREHETHVTDEILSIPAEARAYGFQFWRQGDLVVDGTIAKIYAELKRLLERVSNYFSGRGFQSVEDIYRAIDRGEYALRARREGGVVRRNAERDPADPRFAPDFETFLSRMTLKWGAQYDFGEWKELSNGALSFPYELKTTTAPGTGLTRRFLQDVTDWLDIEQRGSYITVIPHPRDAETGMTLQQKADMYARRGWVPIVGEHSNGDQESIVEMYRDPQEMNRERIFGQTESTGPGARGGVGSAALSEQVASADNGAAGDTSTSPERQYSRAAVDPTVPATPFLHLAGRDLDRAFESGQLPREQELRTAAAMFDPENMPDATARQLYSATGAEMGRLQEFWHRHFASGNYLSRFSQGYRNVQQALSTFTQRKSQLFAHAVNVQMSEWVNANDADIRGASDAIFKATVGGIRKNSSDYMLLYGNLAPKQQAMFRQVFGDAKQSGVIADLLQREFEADARDMQAELPPAEFAEWQVNRRTRVQKLIEDSYVPERRYGDYTVKITRPVADGQNVVLFYEQFESRGEAALTATRYEALLKEKGVESLQVEFGTRHKAERDTSLSLRQFFAAARRHGVELTQVERQRIARALVSADSARLNRIMRRKNIPGHSQDGLRVLSEFALTMASKIAHSEFTDAIEASLQGRAVDTQVVGGKAVITIAPTRGLWQADGPHSGFYRNLADRLADFVLSPPQEGKWAQQLKAAGTLYFLGGNLSFGLVNLTSLPMNTVPWLSAHAPYTQAFSTVLSTFKTVAAQQRLLRDASKLQNRTLPIEGIEDDLRTALIQAAEDGTTLDTEIHHLMGLTKGQQFTNSRKVQKTMDLWMLPFRMSEQINRITTFSSAWRLGRDVKKLQGRDLYKFAQEAVSSTQGRYDEANRPGFGQSPLWSTLFMFKSFPIFMIEMLLTLHKQSPAAAVRMLLGLTMAAGVTGLPFAEDIMDIIDVISQRLFGSAFNSKRAIRNVVKDASEALVGADLSNLFLNGAVNDWLGVNLSTRVGLGNLIPGTRLGAADNDYKRTLEEVLGPAGGMLTAAAGGLDHLTKLEFLDALKAGAPVAARNVVKGVQQLASGEAVDTQGRKLIDVNGWQAFWQTMGFTSAALNKVYQMDHMDRQTLAYYTQVRTDFTHGLIQALRAGDSAQAQSLLEGIQAWNERNPAMPIGLSAPLLRRQIGEAGMPLNERTLRLLPRGLRGTSTAIEGMP